MAIPMHMRVNPTMTIVFPSELTFMLFTKVLTHGDQATCTITQLNPSATATSWITEMEQWVSNTGYIYTTLQEL